MEFDWEGVAGVTIRESGYLSRALEVGFSLVGALPCLRDLASKQIRGYRPLNALRHRKSERFCLYDIRPAVRQRRKPNRTRSIGLSLALTRLNNGNAPGIRWPLHLARSGGRADPGHGSGLRVPAYTGPVI